MKVFNFEELRVIALFFSWHFNIVVSKPAERGKGDARVALATGSRC